MTRKVLILYTGGTFGMDPAEGSRARPLQPPRLSPAILKERFVSRVPELSQLADCEVEVVFNCDSAHMGPEDWLELSRRIQKRWKKFDGFVILHGTDTLAFTASALSMILRPCLKPVVLTGAQRPLAALRSDARRNLISAVEIAASGPTGPRRQVSVFFDDRLLQGNRCRKRSATDFRGFESPKSAPLAVVGASIRYLNPEKKAQISRLKLKPAFERRVAVFHLTPGFPARAVREGMLSQVKGLVLVVFPSGTAPTHDPELIALLRAARKQKIPVIAVTEGETDNPAESDHPPVYSAGKLLLDEGALWAGRMTPECAYIKTSLLLAQPGGSRNFSKLWKTELASEGATE